nr:prealbumin-like fold domain-containing protein [Latilactobacillus fuchuensis]
MPSNTTEVRNGDLEVTKIDGDTKQPLKGVVYSLYDDTGKVYQNNLTTDSQGQFDLHYLPAGTYYLQEDQPYLAIQKIQRNIK